jgi:hypothetical protein
VGLLERIQSRVKSRVAKAAPTVVSSVARSRSASRSRISQHAAANTDEGRLRARLLDDPNDRVAFAELAEIVRAHAAEGHEGESRPRAAADAEWALAEELAHNSRAWYPLIELARLSVHDDLDAAQRRLGTAVERDPTGRALTEALAMLRRENMLDAALSLGRRALAPARARARGGARTHPDRRPGRSDRGGQTAPRRARGAPLTSAPSTTCTLTSTR